MERSEVVTSRVRPWDRERIDVAAALEETTRADVIRRGAIREAERIIRRATGDADE